MVYVFEEKEYDVVTGTSKEVLRKYDTEKMELVTVAVKEYGGQTRFCELYRSKRGKWIVTINVGLFVQAKKIEEHEAKELLMQNIKVYERIFGEIEEG